MDPATITAGVMAILGPLVKKGAETFMEEAGKTIWEKSKGLLAKLKAKWSGDTFEGQTLKHFEQEPENFQSSVESNLRKALADDKDFAEEIVRLIDEIKKEGPDIEIVQEIEKAEKEVTGIEAKEMKRGTAKIKQKISEAKDKVTGAKLERIG